MNTINIIIAVMAVSTIGVIYGLFAPSNPVLLGSSLSFVNCIGWLMCSQIAATIDDMEG